jgi:hypothetical protein
VHILHQKQHGNRRQRQYAGNQKNHLKNIQSNDSHDGKLIVFPCFLFVFREGALSKVGTNTTVVITANDISVIEIFLASSGGNGFISIPWASIVCR